MTVKELRSRAITNTLFRPATLQAAVERLGFVQVDPIRSPARAQDLILRHRVKDYRVGDIERQYEALQLEEDRLYAHGYMPQSTWRLLHPRVARRLTAFEKDVHAYALAHSRIHPRDLDVEFGRRRKRNAWGGLSIASTHALQKLHRSGLLRVAGREKGIRIYQAVSQECDMLAPEDRLRKLVLAIASILRPLSSDALRVAAGYMAYGSPVLTGARKTVSALIASGELADAVVDGVQYVWPHERGGKPVQVKDTVRFLAPFDPLVWDRKRFEHFWDWPYRFEAYVPAPKRQLGYYAMPMLWRDDIIGWVNVANRKQGLDVEPGFKKPKPTEPSFAAAFDQEVGRLELFLQKRPPET